MTWRRLQLQGWLLAVAAAGVSALCLVDWKLGGTPEAPLDAHPHPITPEHQRIQQELRLVQGLNDALDLKDATGMRTLIAEYERHDPADENAMRAGYERIADCLEDPGDRTRAAARKYYDQERASTLRRYVRRVCLEPDGSETAMQSALRPTDRK
jgi:hypothetical protein